MNEENTIQEDCAKGRLKVKVEYCGVCDYEGHCLSLARRLSKANPAVDVVCMRGRKDSFEVFVNEVQIYSKLQTTILPDFDDVIKHVKVASESGLIIPIVTNRCMDRVCDYEGYCLKLARQLTEATPIVDVTCFRGRQGAFEVFINEVQVYSKLQTMALPDFDEVAKAVKVASESGLITPVLGQQPINCVIS